MPTIAMRHLVLRSAAAAALILGSSVAMAQGAGGEHGPGGGAGGPAGGGEHAAPGGGENAAPAGGEHAAPGGGHAAPSGQMKGSPNANGAAREQGAPGERGAPSAQGNAPGSKGEAGRSEQMKGSPNANGAAKGEAGGHAALSGENRTKFVGALRHGHAEAIHHPSDFRIGRGSIIPDHYHFYPLPPDLIEMVPEFRGYDYIIVDDEIIILEPGTRRIVDVIEE